MNYKKLEQLKQWFLSIVMCRYSSIYLEYDDIKKHYRINDKIVSLNDGKIYEYSGFLTLVGRGKKATGFDSHNDKLVVYDSGKLAKVIEKGIDRAYIKQMQHIENVSNTCKKLGCTPSELLHKDYMRELVMNKTNQTLIGVICRDLDDFNEFVKNRNLTGIFDSSTGIFDSSTRTFEYKDRLYICLSSVKDIIGITFDHVYTMEAALMNSECIEIKRLVKTKE